MRAIGLRRRMVQAAFLLESSLIALTAILVGTALGLLLSWNIIRDQRAQPSWEDLELVVPWLNLAVIFLVVYAVALAATFGARHARIEDQARRSAAIPVIADRLGFVRTSRRVFGAREVVTSLRKTHRRFGPDPDAAFAPQAQAVPERR